MKYGKLLNVIKNKDYHYIDYNYLKKQIRNKDFFKILKNNIDFFDKNYKLRKNFNTEIYNYLVINYLSIHKIIKKYNKKNNKKYSLDLSEFKFYQDIINPKYLDEKICSICYDHGFMIKTDCNHEFCFKCLLKCSNEFKNCPNCRRETELDPVLIYINNVISNPENKYSPFLKKTISKRKDLSIDLISDLHIDQWSTEYKIKYPYGIVKDIPFHIDNKSDILVVAGDISDDLNLSLKWMDEISHKYNKILFVDGNHEHVNAYPNLYDINHIHNSVKSLNNDKIIYLPNSEYIIDDIVFIGYCGWWDYDNKQSLESAKTYFNKWIPNFTEKDNIQFMNNVLNRAEYENKKIRELLKKYENDNSINKIILVTHSVGHKDFKVVSKSTDYNTMFNDIKSSKLKYWLFGHTHYQINHAVNNIQYICNPRGRPDDFNRIVYNTKTINI